MTWGSHGATVKMLMLLFWVEMPCGLVGRYHKHRGSMLQQNAGIYLQVHTALLSAMPTSKLFCNSPNHCNIPIINYYVIHYAPVSASAPNSFTSKSNERIYFRRYSTKQWTYIFPPILYKARNVYISADTQQSELVRNQSFSKNWNISYTMHLTVQLLMLVWNKNNTKSMYQQDVAEDRLIALE
jgi:hypothetical protein